MPAFTDALAAAAAPDPVPDGLTPVATLFAPAAPYTNAPPSGAAAIPDLTGSSGTGERNTDLAAAAPAVAARCTDAIGDELGCMGRVTPSGPKADARPCAGVAADRPCTNAAVEPASTEVNGPRPANAACVDAVTPAAVRAFRGTNAWPAVLAAIGAAVTAGFAGWDAWFTRTGLKARPAYTPALIG